MSISLADISQLLSAGNEQLFDRYINFRLTREEPQVASSTVKGRVSSFLSGLTPNKYTPDFQVICPKTGLKPDINVSASFHVNNTSHLITMTVTNMNANIDTMAYNWCEIEVGYYNSGIHATFVGQIINCYMAKPNPNGELVVSVSCANIASMVAQGDFEVKFTTDFVKTNELVSTCLSSIETLYPQLAGNLSPNLDALPGDWLTQEFNVNKSTYRFRSPLACIAWLNSLFASYTYSTGFRRGAGRLIGSMDETDKKLNLPPIRLGFNTIGELEFTATYSKATPGTTKSLSYISSAFLTGTASATVTAPFNPDIAPGEVIFVDSKYFKTRVTAEQVKQKYSSMGNLWWVISMQFTFSTRTTNTMTLQLNNISNKIKAGEG